MSNQIILKKSSVAAKIPVTSDLIYGELALNYADGKLYFRDADNIIQSFTANDTSLVTLTGTQTLTNKTLNSPVITGSLRVPTSNAPAQTTDGEIVWDTAQDVLTVGSGTGRRTMADISTAQTLTNKTLTSPTLNNISLTGTITAGGGVGSAGQVLTSTGVGVQWTSVSGGGSSYTLPIASDITLGGIKIGAGLSIDVDGILSGFNGDYINLSNKPTIPSTVFSTIAVAGQNNVVADSVSDTLTIVAGTNITITTDPSTDSITINSTATGGGGGTEYTLPIASVSTLGGIKIGSGLSVDSTGVVDVIGASGSTASGVVPYDFGYITEVVYTVQDHGSIV